jgi:hypothetical protein
MGRGGRVESKGFHRTVAIRTAAEPTAVQPAPKGPPRKIAIEAPDARTQGADVAAKILRATSNRRRRRESNSHQPVTPDTGEFHDIATTATRKRRNVPSYDNPGETSPFQSLFWKKRPPRIAQEMRSWSRRAWDSRRTSIEIRCPQPGRSARSRWAPRSEGHWTSTRHGAARI